MFHAVFIAALISCGDIERPILDADALLTKAETAYSRRDSVTARSDYDAAVKELNGTQWVVADTNCDRQQHAVHRYVAYLHILYVAEKNGIVDPFDAYQQFAVFEESQGVPGARVLPPMFYYVFAAKDRKLADRAHDYARAIYKDAEPVIRLAHTPPGPHCRWPNVATDADFVYIPGYPDAAREAGIGQAEASVLVHVGADGAILSTKLLVSSTDPSLDRAALSAARSSTYFPRVDNCVRVPGDYALTFFFNPNG